MCEDENCEQRNISGEVKTKGFKMDTNGVISGGSKCDFCEKKLMSSDKNDELYGGQMICEDEFCLQRRNVRRYLYTGEFSLSKKHYKEEDKQTMLIDELKEIEEKLKKIFAEFNDKNICEEETGHSNHTDYMRGVKNGLRLEQVYFKNNYEGKGIMLKFASVKDGYDSGNYSLRSEYSSQKNGMKKRDITINLDDAEKMTHIFSLKETT